MIVSALLVVAFLALVAVLFGLAVVEASLLHLRRSAVAASAKQGDTRSGLLLETLDELPRVMNSVLLAVLFTQVTATSLAGVLAQRWASGAGISIATVLVTLVLFVYGEAIPKTIAIRNPLHHARRLVRFTNSLELALRPLVSALVWLSAAQAPRRDESEPADTVTEHELRYITDEAAAAGEIGLSDAELIERSFHVGDLTVDRILVPVDEIVSVPAEATVSRALGVALAAGHRRLPIADGSSGRLIGFVRLRDIAGSNPTRRVSGLVRDALHVRTDLAIIDVLREMQRANCRLALVEDSTDTTVGMVTVEDIVEELLGPIAEPEPGR